MVRQFSCNLSPVHQSSSCLVEYFAHSGFWVLLGGLPDRFWPFDPQHYFDKTIYNSLAIWTWDQIFVSFQTQSTWDKITVLGWNNMTSTKHIGNAKLHIFSHKKQFQTTFNKIEQSCWQSWPQFLSGLVTGTLEMSNFWLVVAFCGFNSFK